MTATEVPTDETSDRLVDRVRPTRPPIRKAEMAELATEGWLAQARAYLEPRVAERRDALAGQRFAVCEIYTDAPPHLDAPDGVAAIHMVVDDGELTVAAGAIDDADLRLRANYDRSAIIATTVYEQLPERRARVQRELTHRHGEVFEVLPAASGARSPGPAALEVFSGLHDHLARRTLPNPDLGHRLRHLGLERHAAELDEQGYTVVENAITETFADELLGVLLPATERVARTTGAAKPRTAAMLLEEGPLLEELALHPQLVALAQHLLGLDLNLAQMTVSRKPPGGDGLGLHNDPPHPAPGTGTHCFNSTAIWALSEFTEVAGPTVVVPGSHLENRRPDETATERARPILMPKGSFAMWHGATWHGSAPRRAEGERLAIHHTHTRNIARMFDTYLYVDPDVLDRNPPLLTSLCALDDIYGKNSSSGSDFSYLL